PWPSSTGPAASRGESAAPSPRTCRAAAAQLQRSTLPGQPLCQPIEPVRTTTPFTRDATPAPRFVSRFRRTKIAACRCCSEEFTDIKPETRHLEAPAVTTGPWPPRGADGRPVERRGDGTRAKPVPQG